MSEGPEPLVRVLLGPERQRGTCTRPEGVADTRSGGEVSRKFDPIIL